MRGTVDLFKNIDLGSSLYWFLMDTTRGNMPFTIVHREMGVYAQRTAPSDPGVFEEHKLVAGGYSRFVPAWGHPIISSISGPA